MKLFSEIDTNLSPLTKKENQIFSMLAEGLSQREMSESLHRSFATISRHIENIKGKLGANNSTQAVSIGVASGFLTIRRLLLLALVLTSGINAVLPGDVYAAEKNNPFSTENPFVRVRVRGNRHVRTGTQLRLRTATRFKEV